MNPTQYPAYLSNEITFSSKSAVGAKGAPVRRAQEWLSYHGCQTAIDGGYGPATERACKAFQADCGLSVDGTVDAATWAKLVSPLVAAVADVPGIGTEFDEVFRKVAKQHLKQHPVELGGDNCGPWVRAYMKGNDGAQWYWCAGFVTMLMTQAALQLGVSKPLAGSVSCDTLAAQALAANRFIPGTKVANGHVQAGALGGTFIFLVRRSSGDWTHTGLGFDLQGDTFSTIEGNTNDEGSRNGYEVCARTRSIKGKDFIAII